MYCERAMDTLDYLRSNESITDEQYDNLFECVRDAWLLQAMNECGVDNWEGTEQAIDLFNEWMEGATA